MQEEERWTPAEAPPPAPPMAELQPLEQRSEYQPGAVRKAVVRPAISLGDAKSSLGD